MFGDVVDPSIKVGSQKWYTVPLSIIAHVAIFAAVIIIPLMATDVLPTPPSMMAFVGAPPPPPPPPPPPAPAAAQPKVQPVQVTNPNAAPIEAPKEIIPEAPSTGIGEGVPGGVEGGVPGGVVGGVVGGLPEAPPPPPPPPQAPVRVGGNIKAPSKIKNVNPVYPPIAQSARVQGVVIIEATIGPDGRVKDAKVLRSIPLLDQAALDAVKQWQFTPTLLNGVPVPVIMTVTVNFTLQ
jgi:protein TonB